jgi:hypothetical protein
MTRDTLTWLGCSGSLTLALLTVNPAEANTPPLRELVFVAPLTNEFQDVNTPLATDMMDCGCGQGDSESSSQDFTDIEGERAITTFGCDCAGCRNMVRQREEPSSLTLYK